VKNRKMEGDLKGRTPRDAPNRTHKGGEKVGKEIFLEILRKIKGKRQLGGTPKAER